MSPVIQSCPPFPRSSVGTHSTTLQRRVLSTFLLLFAALLSSVSMAAEYLTGKEIKQLLSGTEVWAVKEGARVGSSSTALDQHGRKSIRYGFFVGGSLERYSSGYHTSRNSKGKWWVKKGKLCMEFDDGKKSCSKLGLLDEGRYWLYGKGGKPRNLVFERITPQ